MPKLTIVPPSEAPATEKLRQRITRMPKPASILQCRCGSRKLKPTITGVEYVDGKTRGGTKGFDCALCGAVVL